MENSFGSRPPWNGNMSQSANGQIPRFPAGIDPRLAMEATLRQGLPQMNSIPNLPHLTPTSTGGGYPIWDQMDIPSQMFMQAVNYDRLMAATAGSATGVGGSLPQNETCGRNLDDSQHRSEAGADLMEQQQAVEQVRLLHRFKELRQMQQQQQERLMSEQQQQLTMLRKEQERFHNIMAKQRNQQWGAGHPNTYNEMSTPPRHQLPQGVDLAQLMAYGMPSQPNSQPKSSLPKPVIYVHPKEDDDEIKTNPDLFSDTNSNRGSQAAIEEGMFPIPDSASEASVDVGVQQRFANKVNFQQRFNPHELDAPKKLHRSLAELENDEDFINQSCSSPTLLDMQHGHGHGRAAERRPPQNDRSPGELANVAEDVEEEDDDDDSDDDDDESNDESDEEDDESEEEEDETQENTQIEVIKDPDDIPIKPGIEGTKTFEQLLEEQLRLEEEKLKQASMNTDSPSQPRRNFLKKGEGISRFDKPPKPSTRPKKSHKSQNATGTSSSGKSTAAKAGSKPGSVTHGSQKQGTSKAAGKAAPQPASKTSSQPGQKAASTIPPSKSQKSEPKGKRSGSRSPAGDSAKSVAALNAEGNKKAPKKTSKPESIPDDTSFVACLKEREKESQWDMEELDEFEILEDFADNMSFCSNSSIVTKGLRGLQSDRILPGVVPKSQDLARPTSPRAALIKRLEAEKQAKLRKPEPTRNRHTVHNQNESSDKASSVRTDQSGKAAHPVSKGNGKYKSVRNVDDDEYETVSESSEESSDDSSDESDDEMVETKREIGVGAADDVSRQNLDSLYRSKNDSVLSTDKKLERALSYTGMTETSISQTSQSDLDSDSDDVEEMSEGYEALEDVSPTKTLIRKVAGRDDKAAGPSQNPGFGNTDFLTASFNSSAFVPKSKSPLVISREKVTVSKVPFSKDVEEDFKFSYHSDTDSMGKRRKDSLSDDEGSDEDELQNAGVNEKKTLVFDDDEEWDDGTPGSSKRHSRRDSRGDLDHDKTLVDESDFDHHLDGGKAVTSESSEGTPPTSKLVSKLFPKLKPQQKKKEEQDLQKIQAVAQADFGDGIQSKVLRDKLIELEREIEKFRNENAHLAKLRTEREEGLTKLKKEIADFEKEKAEELKRLEEFKHEEMKKLKHEKKVFEKYQKAARAGPDKKEREEIEMLRSQVAELQEEMKRKESRWGANNTRLRDKMDALDQENEELKEEIKMLERKRLEWMQKDQNKGKGKAPAQVPMRSSTPTEEPCSFQQTNGYPEHGLELQNDLSATSSVRSSSSLKPTHNNPKINIRSSFQPQTKLGTGHPAQQPNKPHNNQNQSSKNTAQQNIPKQNQSKRTITHNSKPVHQAHGQVHSKSGQKTVSKANTGKSVQSADKNVLRNSLAEDLPRRELGTVAEQQDISMYSEADAEISMQTLGNMPRKFASRPGLDKSVIDKGNNDFDETQHSDGKVERTYSNGAREILFSNGTRKEISADGKSIVVSFFNGDYKQIMPDQRVIYYYAEAQTTHSSYPDGLEILQFPNQQTEKLYPDGTKEITFSDQTVKYIFPNGSEESIFADGTVIRLEKNGDKTMEFPNGQREIHTQEYKKREYPDGTVKTVYPDGRQETRYSNGRLRIKDKDGNVIVDRLC